MERMPFNLELNNNYMERTPFNLELAKQGKPFGNEANGAKKTWAYLQGAAYPIKCIHENGFEESYDDSGRYSTGGETPIYDLFMLPEPVVRFGNVYSGMCGTMDYHTLEDAKAGAAGGYLGQIKLTITGKTTSR